MCSGPTLFILLLTVALTILHQSVSEGVYIRTRDDSKLLNLARLKARITTRLELITELLFADDIALIVHSPDDIQTIVNIFVEASNKIGLLIEISKTEVIYQPSPDNNTPHEHVATINGEALKVVPCFKCFGSALTPDNKVDKEISRRIQTAFAYDKLEKKLVEARCLHYYTPQNHTLSTGTT